MVPLFGGVKGDLVEGWMSGMDKMTMEYMMLGKGRTWNENCFYCQEMHGRNSLLEEKLRELEMKNQSLLANNSLLKVQLQESWFRQEDTENEAIRLRSNVGKMRMENEKLIQSVKQLEEKLNRKPAPPPPPPHPPKSLFLNLKNPFLKKQKQFRSVPENIHESHSKQGRMMELSGAVMDAIKNKTYSLRPVQKQTVKRKMVREPQDYNIGEILARRLAMGYGMEEDARSGKSIRSNSTMRSFTFEDLPSRPPSRV